LLFIYLYKWFISAWYNVDRLCASRNSCIYSKFSTFLKYNPLNVIGIHCGIPFFLSNFVKLALIPVSFG
jgi:hypothetical protein